MGNPDSQTATGSDAVVRTVRPAPLYPAAHRSSSVKPDALSNPERVPFLRSLLPWTGTLRIVGFPGCA